MPAKNRLISKSAPGPKPNSTGCILQRKCACGGTRGPSGECEECRRKGLQRSNTQSQGRAFFEPRFGYDFSQIRHVDPTAEAGSPLANERFIPSVAEKAVAGSAEALNKFGETETDPIHSQMVQEFREREHLLPEGGDPAGARAGPSLSQIKYGGLLLPCPQSTEVAAVIDMRNDGLSAGFGTAYGIHSQMRVRPDAKTWDGTHIVESLTAGANTCPETLTKGAPCSGNSIFIVGAASGGSAVLPAPRPGAINRFWDFHTTQVKPKNVSVLHDAARNPAHLDTCSTVCNQEYRCEGNLIGRHPITRKYSKGKHNGQNVTFVDVTKT